MTPTATVLMIAAEPNTTAAPLQSVLTLCNALRLSSIRYCHWKSNNALDRSAAGDNDLDLLIARGDSPRFSTVLADCGFKLANAPADKQMPGVQDYFAYDTTADKWVHVHAHFQLVAGHDLSKNYRIAIEEPYIESAVQGHIFKIPQPEFEFIVFVIRMVLKHSTWDSIAARDGRLKAAERREFAYLRERADPLRTNELLERHLPYVGVRLFWRCVDSLADGASVRQRLSTGRKLRTALNAYARRGRLSDVAIRLKRRVVSVLRRHVHGATPKYHLANGSLAIAIVGGDGAGKSTAIEGLRKWVSMYFQTECAHLGKPSWSPVTRAVRTFLKLGHVLGFYAAEGTVRETLAEKSRISPGYAWLIREVCRARDRYWTYVNARRRVANGGLVFFDRFPLKQVELMDGCSTRRFVKDLAVAPGATQPLRPRTEHPLVRFLVKLEEYYYKGMVNPELLIVLRVDPETAVERKRDEQEDDVRARSTAIWSLNWQGTGAHVVDASKGRAEVLAELKQLIWSRM
jgi:thymidylate kinase